MRKGLRLARQPRPKHSLERAIRHGQARNKFRRNVASLILVPDGQEGRPSKAMTLDQAVRLLDHVRPGSEHRLAAYVVVSLLARGPDGRGKSAPVV